MNAGVRRLGLRVRRDPCLSFYSGKPPTGPEAPRKLSGWPRAPVLGLRTVLLPALPVPREGPVWRSPVHCGGQRRRGWLPACRGDNSWLLPELGLLSSHSLLSTKERKPPRPRAVPSCSTVLRITAEVPRLARSNPKWTPLSRGQLSEGGPGEVIWRNSRDSPPGRF